MKPTNPEAFNEVLDWLDRGAPEHKGIAGFYMGTVESRMRESDREWLIKKGYYAPHCGTVCCIAGAMSRFSGDVMAGMTTVDKDKLFFMVDECEVDIDSVTPALAAKVVRHYIKTGRVNWKLKAPKQPL